MSEEKETKKSAKIEFGNSEDLQKFISTVVSEAIRGSNEVSSDVLAKAILEARKPYVDPSVKENEENFKRANRKLFERQRREREADRENCPHRQGSNALSEFQSPLSSFLFHQTDTGDVIGICTNCQKTIHSADPNLSAEDRKWFKEKSANKMSRSGSRFFSDPLKAQRIGAGFQQPDGEDELSEVELAIAASTEKRA